MWDQIGTNSYFFDYLPDFVVGECVRHRRYGYRGVVVDFTMTMQADEHWYTSNMTQPEREQPWYHVLVHGSGAVTYAAQSSLMVDSSGLMVDHFMMPEFFDDFVDGRYIRNDRVFPWEGIDS